MVDDCSEVCETELKPGACYNYGPVLVYYSYQPYQNSRLQDFAIARRDAFRIGEFAFVIGLLLLVLPSIALFVFPRKGKSDDDSNSEEEELERKSCDELDDLHVVPDR